ncbi:MAG: hypothetical protein R3232_00995 [Clostridia bacterium]|nr:hypothetical protein [Clostridia bacterium]
MIIVYGLLNLTASLFALNAYNISRIRGKKSISSEIPDFLYGIRQIMIKYGITQWSDIILYISLPIAGIALGAAAAAIGNFPASIVLTLSPAAVVLFMLAARKRKAAHIFQKNAYKLYKYIMNQATAGIRPGEAMKNMYEVVEDVKLRNVLMKACAKYSISMNAGVLSGEILRNIDTPEARSFAMTIRDGLFESNDPGLMERLEQLMFNRYFAYIQRATDNVKTRCLASVVILCSVIVVMVLVPTILDVQNALNSIFTH